MKYKFLDVGCKIGGSFTISNKFGYKKEEGLGVDIDESHISNFNKLGFNGVVGDATNLPFENDSFELVIFSHVIEHLPNESMGRKALEECIRVSSKYVFLALPFFDEDDYLNSLGFKTYYSDWTGHTNIIHLKDVLSKYLKGYKYDLTMKKKITNSLFTEIHPLSSPIDSHEYNETDFNPKEMVNFDRNIWREYTILIKKYEY